MHEFHFKAHSKQNTIVLNILCIYVEHTYIVHMTRQRKCRGCCYQILCKYGTQSRDNRLCTQMQYQELCFIQCNIFVKMGKRLISVGNTSHRIIFYKCSRVYKNYACSCIYADRSDSMNTAYNWTYT